MAYKNKTSNCEFPASRKLERWSLTETHIPQWKPRVTGHLRLACAPAFSILSPPAMGPPALRSNLRAPPRPPRAQGQSPGQSVPHQPHRGTAARKPAMAPESTRFISVASPEFYTEFYFPLLFRHHQLQPPPGQTHLLAGPHTSLILAFPVAFACGSLASAVISPPSASCPAEGPPPTS